MKTVTLNTGAEMPMLGLGTWKSKDNTVGNAVTYALTEAGYRHIDCAWIYKNEEEVGEALTKVFSEGKVKREEVFITGKLWNSFHKKEDVANSCKESLTSLKLEYLDLYLMHWGMATPAGDEPGARMTDENGKQIFEKVPIRETWEAMEDLVKAGLVRAIGVANFTTALILDLLSYAKVLPAMNQIELHPYFQQSRVVEFCQYHGIAVTAYSPLGSPGNYGTTFPMLVDEPVIISIGEAQIKTPAQVLIRWAIERNTVVIPKSVHPERILENAQVFDFSLNASDMEAMSALERNHRFVDTYEWAAIPYFN